MINFAGIVPHSPLLVKTIGKEHSEKLKKTVKSLESFNKKIISSGIETLVIISPHGNKINKNFLINMKAEYSCGFGDFGDFSTKAEYQSDIVFINELRKLNETKLPVHLSGDGILDHGFGVPLHFLLKNNKKIKIVPINTAELSLLEHFELGKNIKEVAYSDKKNVGLIASAALSHRLSYNSPQGFSPQAKEFDKKLVQLLKKQNHEAILNLDESLLTEALPCGLTSISMLLGSVYNLNYDFEVLSYEYPFGVGYLVAEFQLNLL